MQRQNIIILIEQDKEPIARGNFKKLCEEFNFPYHSLKMLKFPITYKDFIIHRVAFK
jgi:cyclophilin family peptidyl-prolyl cis-trans isomerase